MIKGAGVDMSELSESLYITNETYSNWQNESKAVGIQDSVVSAIKTFGRVLLLWRRRTEINYDIISLIDVGEKRTS